MGPLEKYRIKILDKFFAILSLFDEKGRSLSTQEISDSLGYNKSTIYRIVRNLEERAYLQRDPVTQKYSLGFAIYHLGSLAESYGRIRSLAHPLLVQLNEKCDETVHLAVLQNGQALYVDKIESRNRVLQIISKIGATLPSHCSAVGKVLLASLTASDLDKVIEEYGLEARTKNTIVDEGRLKKEIQEIRQSGFGIDNEEIECGLRCIAAPIRNGDGKVIAAVSISAPKERFDHEFDRFKILLNDTVGRISTVLKG